MTETPESIDLVSLFGAAAKAVAAQKEEINALDGYNGNHGDNMVRNTRIVRDALRAHKADPPDKALRAASTALQKKGLGGTSQYYSRGLAQAAEQMSGKTELKTADGISLIQSLLGAIPAQGYPQAEETTPSVLDLFTTMAEGSTQAQAGGLLDMLSGLTGATTAQEQPQTTQAGGLLDMLSGLTGAQPAQPAQTQAASAEQGGLDMGDILGKLLPAGLAYLQAKQSGADSSQAMQAALVSAVLGVQPGQAQTPRQGAGAALAQGMLKALLGRR